MDSVQHGGFHTALFTWPCPFHLPVLQLISRLRILRHPVPWPSLPWNEDTSQQVTDYLLPENFLKIWSFLKIWRAPESFLKIWTLEMWDDVLGRVFIARTLNFIQASCTFITPSLNRMGSWWDPVLTLDVLWAWSRAPHTLFSINSKGDLGSLLSARMHIRGQKPLWETTMTLSGAEGWVGGALCGKGNRQCANTMYVHTVPSCDRQR